MKSFSASKGWAQAKHSLLEILGQQKTSTAHRWVVLARDVDEEALSHSDPQMLALAIRALSVTGLPKGL